MKKIIYNYYNILIDNYEKEGLYYSFYYKDKLYYFYEVFNDLEILKDVYSYLVDNNVECYSIIKNKDNEIFTKVDNKYYSLILVNGINKYEFKVDEFKYYFVDKEPLNWGLLWSKRMDYYELQLRELGISHQNILNSFGFFSGMAENAILYYNSIIKISNNEKYYISLMHYRLNYPCYSIEYNNPLNYVIDYSVRDVSEYIKSYMLSDDYDYQNIIILLDNLGLNSIMFNLLYARLLYPSFYFDIYEKILLENKDDNSIIYVVEKTDIYLEMLRNIFVRYKDKYNLLNVEWINKKM